MPPQISPGALQMLLPFMKKLALSPKGEQPVELARGLMGLTEGAAPQVSPWQKLARMIPHEGGMVDENLAMYPERGRFSFAFKPQGTRGDTIGSMGPGDGPKDAYVQYMGSSNSKRLGTGDHSQPMQDYRMDLSQGPAQMEMQGRGFQPPVAKQQRAMRSPEDRAQFVESHGEPGALPTMGQKMRSADAFTRILRKAGFEGLTFSAEAGERPRLYEKLVGYKAQPVGETTLENMMGRLPGRQAAPAPPTNPLEHAMQSSGMSPQFAENILGLSVDEALDYGLLRRSGSSFQLTDQGRRSAQEFLGGQGRL